MISDWVGCGWMSWAMSEGSVPVVDQLPFGDELAHPAAHQVDAEHASRTGPVGTGLGDDLGRALGLQDDALAVGTQRVVDLDDLEAALRHLGRRQADRCDLGVAVGYPGHAVVVDRADLEPADPLGHHDALGEADVRQLRGVDEVTDRGDRRNAGPAERVYGDEAPLERDAVLLVARSEE